MDLILRNKKHIRLYFTAFITILVCTNSSAFAQAIDGASIEQNHQPLPLSQSEDLLMAVMGTLDQTHSSISSGVENMVGTIDTFFADDKAFEQATDSYLRVALDMVSREYGGTGFAGDLKLRADLPRTKKRLKLLIETDSQRDSKENLEDIPSDVVQQRDYFISIERKVGGKRVWDIRPALGIKVRTPIDPFARLRSYRYFQFNTWLMRASNNLTWFDSKGYGANGSLEFDRTISEKLLFRSTSTLSWQEEEKFRRFDQGFSIFQTINPDENLAYQIAAFADDEFDWLANSYLMRVRYRKQLYKKWMFGEIIPQWDFRRESGFHGEPSITLRLEMVFGSSYQ